MDLKAYFTNGCSKCDQFVNRLANKSKQQEDPEQDLSCEVESSHGGRAKGGGGGGGGRQTSLAQRSKRRRRSSVESSVSQQEAQGSQTAAKNIRKKDWRLSRERVESRRGVNIYCLSGLALVGIASIIAQLELIVHDADVHALEVEAWKGLNTVVSVFLVAFLLRDYYLQDLVGRIDDHIRRNRPLDFNKGKWEFLFEVALWVEIVVCVPHLPPSCTFTIKVSNFGNFLLYRAEQMGVCYGMLRIYLLWRLVKRWALADLPSKSAVSLITNVRLGSSFALKRMLNGLSSTMFLILLWLISCGLIAYLYRAAEMTACQFASTHHHQGCAEWNESGGTWQMTGKEPFRKENDVYVWTSLWVAAMTTTSVGYGDRVPTTHYGRFLAAVITMIGIVLGSLLTAALGNVLRWSSPEFYANVLLDREVARKQIEQQSAMLIQLWWRQYKNRKGIQSHGWRAVAHSVLDRQAHLEHRVRDAVGALSEAKKKVHKPVEDCLSHSDKLTQALRKVKELEGRVEDIGRLLWQKEKEQGAGPENDSEKHLLHSIHRTNSSGNTGTQSVRFESRSRSGAGA